MFVFVGSWLPVWVLVDDFVSGVGFFAISVVWKFGVLVFGFSSVCSDVYTCGVSDFGVFVLFGCLVELILCLFCGRNTDNVFLVLGLLFRWFACCLQFRRFGISGVSLVRLCSSGLVV